MFCSCNSGPVPKEERLDKFPCNSANAACGEGQPMSRWYPCRISCKPSQGPPMRGTCPPKRLVERLVRSYADKDSATSWKYSGKTPCLPGKAVPNLEPTSVGAGHQLRSFSQKRQKRPFPTRIFSTRLLTHVFGQSVLKRRFCRFYRHTYPSRGFTTSLARRILPGRRPNGLIPRGARLFFGFPKPKAVYLIFT